MPCDASSLSPRRAAGLAEFLGFGVGGGQKGDAVHTKQAVFVGRAREDEFTDLGLPALHGALDLVGLEE